MRIADLGMRPPDRMGRDWAAKCKYRLTQRAQSEQPAKNAKEQPLRRPCPCRERNETKRGTATQEQPNTKYKSRTSVRLLYLILAPEGLHIGSNWRFVWFRNPVGVEPLSFVPVLFLLAWTKRNKSSRLFFSCSFFYKKEPKNRPKKCSAFSNWLCANTDLSVVRLT